jgi:hypothetical protein
VPSIGVVVIVAFQSAEQRIDLLRQLVKEPRGFDEGFPVRVIGTLGNALQNLLLAFESKRSSGL